MTSNPPNIAKQLQEHNFTKLFQEASHPREKIRFLAFIHLKDGKGPSEVANIVKVTRDTIQKWKQIFQSKGIEGLREQGGRGKKALIPENEREAFRLAVLDLQKKRKGGCIIGKDVLYLMEEKYGIKCSLKSAYNHLRKASLVWISSRSKHPNADLKKQLEFKKTFNRK